MPKYNADEQVYEPIEITLGGVDYKIKTVKQDMLDRVAEVSKEAKKKLAEGKEDIGLISAQLGIILDADPKIFVKLDIRRANGTLRFLTKTITEQLEGKKGNA